MGFRYRRRRRVRCYVQITGNARFQSARGEMDIDASPHLLPLGNLFYITLRRDVSGRVMSLSSENKGLAPTSRGKWATARLPLFYDVHRDRYYANYSSCSTCFLATASPCTVSLPESDFCGILPPRFRPTLIVHACHVKDLEDLDRVTFGVLCTVIYSRRRPCPRRASASFFPITLRTELRRVARGLTAKRAGDFHDSADA